MSERTEIIQVLNVLYLAYPKHEAKLSDEQVVNTNELYIRLLGDIETPLLKAAAEQHIAESEWFPTVAELRNRAHSLTSIAKDVMGAEEAWGAVIKMASSRGYQSTLDERKSYLSSRGCNELTVALIMRAVDSVGWRDICYGDEDAIGVIRAHFYRTYSAFEKRETEREKMLPEVRKIVAMLADKWTVPQLSGASHVAK